MFIKVKVFPGSKKEEVKKKKADALEIRVKEEAENNMANKKVVEILAEHFGAPKNKIRLIKGAKQRSKIFDIDI